MTIDLISNSGFSCSSLKPAHSSTYHSWFDRQDQFLDNGTVIKVQLQYQGATRHPTVLINLFQSSIHKCTSTKMQTLSNFTQASLEIKYSNYTYTQSVLGHKPQVCSKKCFGLTKNYTVLGLRLICNSSNVYLIGRNLLNKRLNF